MKVQKRRKNLLITYILVLLFLIVPTKLKAQVPECNYTISGTGNGDCFDVTLSEDCGPDGSCVYNYGGCDWGDVSVFYINVVCSQ